MQRAPGNLDGHPEPRPVVATGKKKRKQNGAHRHPGGTNRSCRAKEKGDVFDGTQDFVEGINEAIQVTVCQSSCYTGPICPWQAATRTPRKYHAVIGRGNPNAQPQAGVSGRRFNVKYLAVANDTATVCSETTTTWPPTHDSNPDRYLPSPRHTESDSHPRKARGRLGEPSNFPVPRIDFITSPSNTVQLDIQQ